ncbi:unnamed protein product, partial [Brassica rapa subsp. trilocularis]
AKSLYCHVLLPNRCVAVGHFFCCWLLRCHASNLYLQPLSDKYDFTQVSFVCSHWAVHNYTPRFGLCLEQMWFGHSWEHDLLHYLESCQGFENMFVGLAVQVFCTCIPALIFLIPKEATRVSAS